MEKQEIKEYISQFDMMEIIENAIGTLSFDIVSVGKLLKNINDLPICIRDAWYWTKFGKFLSGVNNINEKYSESVKLSSKLFSSEDDRRRNGLRLINEIEKADSIDKIQYLVNATKSLLLGRIDNVQYFRVANAIMNTLSEDLVYLKEKANHKEPLKANASLLALERSGLTIQSGIDANAEIEEQNYVISKLGKLVNDYALSDDE